MTGPKAPRELTPDERAAIRSLVRRCANYDAKVGCLPLDDACYMLGKVYTGALCRYFAEVVLPLDPALEASLRGSEAVGALRCCTACGGLFSGDNRRRYCCAKCAVVARRRATAQRVKKHRKNGDAL